MDTLVPKALMIRWSLHPFLITLTGALPFCPTTLKNAQRILDHVLIDVPGDEDDACAVIIAGPCVQFQGRMEDVLHAVNTYWPRSFPRIALTRSSHLENPDHEIGCSLTTQ